MDIAVEAVISVILLIYPLSITLKLITILSLSTVKTLDTYWWMRQRVANQASFFVKYLKYCIHNARSKSKQHNLKQHKHIINNTNTS